MGGLSWVCSPRDEVQDQFSDSWPSRRGRVEEQVAGVKLVKLDGSSEASGEVARVLRSIDTIGFALQDQRRRLHRSGRATRADGQLPQLGDGRGVQAHASTQLGTHLGTVQVQLGRGAGKELAQLGTIQCGPRADRSWG